MRRRATTAAVLALACGLLAGCTNRKNSEDLNSGAKGPPSPAVSGNPGDTTNGAPNTSPPNSQAPGTGAGDQQKKQGSATSTGSKSAAQK